MTSNFSFLTSIINQTTPIRHHVPTLCRYQHMLLICSYCRYLRLQFRASNDGIMMKWCRRKHSWSELSHCLSIQMAGQSRTSQDSPSANRNFNPRLPEQSNTTMSQQYTGTSVHERPCSRTIRFTNKFSEQTPSRMTNGVSDYEHASWQQRLATSWEYRRVSVSCWLTLAQYTSLLEFAVPSLEFHCVFFLNILLNKTPWYQRMIQLLVALPPWF
jgi:hypothetical protein